MRGAQVLAVMAFVGSAAVSPAYAQAPAAKMPKPDVGPGRAAWFDITTSNLASAKTFYGGLFDWKFTPLKGTDLAVEIVSRDLPIGTIRVAEGTITAFNGVVYIQVTDLPASCKKATELGAKIVPGFPFNLPDEAGAVALMTDPSGHPIGMYSRTVLVPAK
jgi:predicted enzyme related to lactoylglutathione lyase